MAPLDEHDSARAELTGEPPSGSRAEGTAQLPGDQELESLSRGLRTDLRRLGVPEDSTGDMVQETWLRALRQPTRAANLPSWLRVVSRRLAWEWRRADRNRRDRELLGARSSAWSGESPEGESALAKLVRELPQPYARAVELRYLEGYSPREIARLLGCPPATVRSWLKRGLDLLRKRLPEDPELRSRYLALGVLALGPDLERSARGPGWLHGQGARMLALGGVGLAFVVVVVLGVFETSGSRGGPTEEIARAPSDPGSAGGFRATDLVVAPRAALPEPEAPPAPPRPSLAGVVRDPEGRPVAGAQVHVGTPRGRSDAPPVTTCDEQGRYALFGLGADALVWATLEAWCESSRCYVATVGPERIFDLRLQPGERRRLRFESPEGLPLSESVVQVGGLAHLVPELSAAGALEFPPGPVEGRCDARGEVELRLPLLDEYHYELRFPEGSVRSGRFTIPERGLAEGEPVLVRLAALSALEGRVSYSGGRPAAGAFVEALQSGEVTGEGRVESDGSFRLDGLPSGNYDLRAYLQDPRALDSFAESGQLAEGEVKRREVVLSPEHSLVAEIVAPVSLLGTTVELKPLSLYEWERRSQRFALADDGLLVVPACRSVEHRVLVTFADGLASLCRKKVVPGNTRLRLFIEAPQPPGDVSVKLVGEDPSLTWTWVELRNGFGPGSLVAPVDPDTGVADFRDVPSGDFQVFAWAPGFGTWAFRENYPLPASAPLRLTIPRASPVTLDVQVPPGVDPELVTAAVVIPCFNMLGFDGQGTRLAWKHLARTAPGRFETELPPGEYRFRVRCPGTSECEQRLEVPAQGELRAAIPLRLSTSIALTLVPERPLAKGEAVRFEVLDEIGTLVQEGLLTTLETPSLMLPFEAHRVLFRTPRGLQGELTLEPGVLSGDALQRRVVRLAEPEVTPSEPPEDQGRR